jgi:tetratricopeptide (TPR) repeat protein
MKSRFLFFIIFSLLCASPSYCYSIEGVVFDLEGKPLPDAVVVAINDQHREISRDYANRKGEFLLSNLSAGTYTLEASKSGSPKANVEVTLSGPSQTTFHEDIHLADFIARQSITKSTISEFYLPLNQPLSSAVVTKYKKGMKYLDKQKFEQARKCFEDAILADPKFGRAYMEIGLIEERENNAEKALELLTKAHECNPADPWPLIHLAEHRDRRGEADSAFELLQEAARLDAQLPRTHFLIGRALFKQGKWAEAANEFTLNLSLQPEEISEMRLMLGEIYIKLDRPDEARDQLSAYLKLNPSAPNYEEIRTKIRALEAEMMKN